MARAFTPPKPKIPPMPPAATGIPEPVVVQQVEQAREQGRQDERVSAARADADAERARVDAQERERRAREDATARARGGRLRGRALLLTGEEIGRPIAPGTAEPAAGGAAPPLQRRLGG